LQRALASVGRAIVSDPEDSASRLVWRLAHDQIDQIVKMVNSCAWATQAEDSGVSNIPRRQIGQGPLSFVFMLDTAV
jgi:hypothetical protein